MKDTVKRSTIIAIFSSSTIVAFSHAAVPHGTPNISSQTTDAIALSLPPLTDLSSEEEHVAAPIPATDQRCTHPAGGSPLFKKISRKDIFPLSPDERRARLITWAPAAPCDRSYYEQAAKRFNNNPTEALCAAHADFEKTDGSYQAAKDILVTIPEDDLFGCLAYILAWHKLNPRSYSLDNVINTQKIIVKNTRNQITLNFSCIGGLTEFFKLKTLFIAFTQAQWPSARITVIE